MIALIDQQARQGVGIQLHPPADKLIFPHIDVRHHRRRRFRAEGRAGAGGQGAKLGDHLAQILVVDAAGALQPGHVAAGEHLQIVEHGLHGRIAAVALLQLQHQAFAHVAGEHAGGLEPLKPGQHPLHHRLGAAQPLGDFGDRGAQIAALVHAADQGVGDQPFSRSEPRHGRLIAEDFRQGAFLGDAAVDALAVGVERAAAVGLGPVHRPAGVADRAARDRFLSRIASIASGSIAGRGVGVKIVVAGVEIGFGPAAGDFVGKSVAQRRFGHWRLTVRLAVALVAGEQRIALDLGLHIGFEFEIRQLQQLDRLLQLGRYDQRLALTQF